MNLAHYNQSYNSHLAGGAWLYETQCCKIVARDWSLGRHSLGNNVAGTVVGGAWQAHLGPGHRLAVVNYSDLLELLPADVLRGLVAPSQSCEAVGHGINVVKALDVAALLWLNNSLCSCDLYFCLHVRQQS